MENIILVSNEPKYYEFIRFLRTTEENISGFLNQSSISENEQLEYMEKYGNCYYIALLNENPVGFVGIIDDDIRVATHPEFKKMGVGKFMINEIIKKFPKSFAKIKLDNESSVKLFESCGFKKHFLIMKK